MKTLALTVGERAGWCPWFHLRQKSCPGLITHTHPVKHPTWTCFTSILQRDLHLPYREEQQCRCLHQNRWEAEGHDRPANTSVLEKIDITLQAAFNKSNLVHSRYAFYRFVCFLRICVMRHFSVKTRKTGYESVFKPTEPDRSRGIGEFLSLTN